MMTFEVEIECTDGHPYETTRVGVESAEVLGDMILREFGALGVAPSPSARLCPICGARLVATPSEVD